MKFFKKPLIYLKKKNLDLIIKKKKKKILASQKYQTHGMSPVTHVESLCYSFVFCKEKRELAFWGFHFLHQDLTLNLEEMFDI
jgi:hypothetical protein